MTIHEAVLSPVRQPLLGILYLLLTAQMALFLASVRDGRSRRVRLCLLAHLLFSFVCLWLPLLDISCQLQTDPDAYMPALCRAVLSLPVRWMFLYEAVTALILAAVIWDTIRYRRSHPTAESVKETMDNLPVGIAFGQPDGTVVLNNLMMDRLSRILTGRGIRDLCAFREAMPDGDEGDEESEDGVYQVPLPDGSGVWQITFDTAETNEASFIRVTATDITEEAAVTEELAEKNKKLRDIQMRLKLYNMQADKIVIAQELLTARMAVHSEVGTILLESRHYLKDPSSYNEEKLLAALKNANTYLLREYEQDDTARDVLTDALERARTIGVDVTLTGPIPPAGPHRRILAAAVGECATNTVKHADGDRVSAELSAADDGLVYTLRSGSGPVEGEIRESGGLQTLRALVERNGGTMQTEGFPCFTLTIRLPKTIEGPFFKADTIQKHLIL